MKYFNCLLLMILVGWLAVPAQTAPEKGVAKDNSLYRQLVDRARSGDTTVNFGELRRAYVEWLNNPANKTEAPKRDEMVKAFEAKNYAKAVELGEIVVDFEFVHSGLLGAMADAYKKLGDDKKAAFFEGMAHKAKHAVFLSGDGKTTKTAYYVMNISEEYRVMRELGHTVTSQSLMTADGQSFDVLSGKDEKGKSVEVYFNICAFFPCGLR